MAGAALMPWPVLAQAVAANEANVDMFTRTRNVSVQSRPRPDYEAIGARFGSFYLYPRVEVQAELNDNIYANQTEVDDTIWHLRPEVVAESDWSNHFVTAYARGAIKRFTDHESENSEEVFLGGSGRIDATRRTKLGFGADYADSVEPRTSPSAPDNSREPVNFEAAQAFASASHTGGRLRLSARGDWRELNYQDGRTGAGAPIDQDFRDRAVTSLTGRVDYAVSPDTAFFLQATVNSRDYEVDTIAQPGRDSTGSEVVAGASFELGASSRGELAVGYIEQDFDNPTYNDFSGFGARAQLEWFVSELTTVTAAAGRTVEDAANPGVGGFLSTNGNMRIDHELLRNVVLSGQLIYGRDEYEDIDREDRRTGAILGATYFLNRNLGLNLSASTLDTSSSGANADIDYRVNKVALALVAQF